MTADRQEAMLERLRSKGLGLAPHMVDGKVTPRGSGTKRAGNGAGRAVSAPQGSSDTLTHSEKDRPLASAIPVGTVFEFTIPAPCEFLNANRDKGGHWGPKALKVRKWRFAGHLAAKLEHLPQGLDRVRIDAYVVKPVRNRFDPSNYAPTSKATTDGFTDYGLFPDDDRTHVEGPFMHDGGKGEPGLRIVVTVLA